MLSIITPRRRRPDRFNDRLAAAAWGAAVYGLAGPLVLLGAGTSWMRVGLVGFVVGVSGVGLVSPAGRRFARRDRVCASLVAGVIGGTLSGLGTASGFARLLESSGPAMWLLFLVTCVVGGAVLGMSLAFRGLIAPLRLVRDGLVPFDGSWNWMRAASAVAAAGLWLGAAFLSLGMAMAAGTLVHLGQVSQQEQPAVAVSGVSDVFSTAVAGAPDSLPDSPAASPPDTAGRRTERSSAERLLSELLGRPFSPTARGDAGLTDLHYAAALNLPSLAYDLLEAGARVDARYDMGDSDRESVRVLRELRPWDRRWGALGYSAQDRLTPLHLAGYFDAPDVVAALLDQGADVHAGTGALGLTPLHMAAFGGAYGSAIELLARGADLEFRAAPGWTPLHVAAFEGTPTAAILLEAGADIGARDDDGRTPLHHAAAGAWRAGTTVLEELLDRGADIHAADGALGTPLHVAADGNRQALTAVRILLDRGADVGARDAAGRTPLHHAADAAYDDDASIVRLLLDRGAAFDARDGRGRTPLHVASSSEEATALLDRGADVHARDADGNTPLREAVQHKVEVPTVLILRGADVNATNSAGETPLDRTRADYDAMRTLLRGHGAR